MCVARSAHELNIIIYLIIYIVELKRNHMDTKNLILPIDSKEIIYHNSKNRIYYFISCLFSNVDSLCAIFNV